MAGRGGGSRHYRQFECPDCPPPKEHFDAKRWFKRVPDSNPYSTCNGCDKQYHAIEIGEERGVGACSFVCECGSKYTVICRMTDTAKCYQCFADNEPEEMGPRRRIDRKSENKHSCSRCKGKKNCPNLS